MRITGNDKEGQDQLGNFIDPESRYPVLVTTSRLLSTGVDAQTCRLIVLDREVGSMTEFKQIVGRGTRVHEDTRKFYFTLMDFRGATSHFADPDFDGEPVQIYEPGPGEPIAPPVVDDAFPIEPNPDEIVRRPARHHDPTGRDLSRQDLRRWCRRPASSPSASNTSTQDGKLVTESLRDYTKKALRKRFASLDDFLRRWNATERKQAIVDELTLEGLPLDIVGDELGKNLDPFDLICHVAFDAKPLTRRERADSVKKTDVFARHGEQARAVLDALLTKYADGRRPQSRRSKRASNRALFRDRHTRAASPRVRRQTRFRTRRPPTPNRTLPPGQGRALLPYGPWTSRPVGCAAVGCYTRACRHLRDSLG